MEDTYDTEGSDENIRGSRVVGHHNGDEVGSHANDGNERDTLQATNDGVGCT